jgi:hypothetical protein
LADAVYRTAAAYEASEQEFGRVKQRVRLNHPDGRAALQQATEAFTQALEEYRRAVVTFNNFVLHDPAERHKEP